MVDGERRTIFSGLSFAIEPGEIVDLVGPSGAGKSSLLTAFARLNPRASGDLRLDGRSADDFTPQQWRAQVAYLPQKPVLLGETVAQAIRLPFTLAIRQSARTKQGPRRISPTDALPDGRIRETLDNMGCADIDLNRPPHDLSGGQAARVSLARTLLTRPKVLLADEVDAGLDDDNADRQSGAHPRQSGGGRHGDRSYPAPAAGWPCHTCHASCQWHAHAVRQRRSGRYCDG